MAKAFTLISCAGKARWADLLRNNIRGVMAGCEYRFEAFELMTPSTNSLLPFAERKRLGAFYTPEVLSRILSNWAIQKPSDIILEPSFGGCGFLVAASRRLEELGAESPKDQICGCDVDDGAFEFLANTLGQPVNSKNFLHGDFLSLRSLEDWPTLFDATIGNPPYIPYQSILEDWRHQLIQRASALGVSLGGKASLWAHFLIHAVSFVAPGGRMAWVLPGSFLQADYAINVRRYLSQSFGDVICILMHERFFKTEGTEEETVVLLAKNRGHYPDGSTINFIDSLDVARLQVIIDAWESGVPQGQPLEGRPSFLSASESVANIYKELCGEDECHVLGDVLQVNIGVVTGANQFFVIDKNKAAGAGLRSSSLLPVLSKFRFSKGLSFTGEDFAALVNDGSRGYLISPKTPPATGSALAQYLDGFTVEARSKVSTFKKRSIWYAPDDGRIPDAFFPVMNHHGPRLVLNDAKVTCTNTIHRAFFYDSITGLQRKLVSISMLTSFSQLSAEFVGRRYGSGVLKHEPREAEKIAVYLPLTATMAEVDAIYAHIDGLLRQEKYSEASLAADNFIFNRIKGGEAIASTFALALAEIRELRKTNRFKLGV